MSIVLTLKLIQPLANKCTYLLLICCLITCSTFSQQGGLIRQGTDRLKQFGNMRSGGGGGDSLKRRDKNEDSITVHFRYLDSTRNYTLDSSINDFTRRFPIPATHVYLGNNGTATRSILFSPLLKPGWDPGFHAFDVYKWALDKARFFNTTRPYSELAYQLAGKGEQMIELMHTQNIKPNWNFLFQYRLLNAPGYFNKQKTNHNTYTFTSFFESVNRRYRNYFIFAGNKLQSGENGGIKTDEDYLNDPAFNDRFLIPTNLGGDPDATRNPFDVDVGTGNRYSETNFLFRQQYDLGKKDSLVTDSTVIPLFYPRVRFEHTFLYGKYKYEFRDYIGDSNYYKNNYALTLGSPIDTVFLKDQFREFNNDFSIYQFPDANNLQQFIRLGAAIQNIQQQLPATHNYYNVYGHAEYRNRTRNQKWYIEANGKLYFAGLNFGDYSAFASLQRSTGKKVPGYAQLGFENISRTPSYFFNPNSAFHLDAAANNFKNENTSHLFASLLLSRLRLRLSGDYYLLTNYTYVTNYYQLRQFGSIFNVLRVAGEKTFKFGKSWYWHLDVYFQKTIGNSPVNLPLVFTRTRIGYEGSLGFKRLNIAMGLESRYHTPYNADNYSPALGQFFFQDSVRISNLPDLAAYIHFRIRGFKLYFRLENLNTLEFSTGTLTFTNNNLAAPAYPLPGLLIRFGVYWSFIN